jgi:hypothetical protein
VVRVADAKHHAYVFVKSGTGFPEALRKKTASDPPLHYVAPTKGVFGALVVLATETPEEADLYVAVEVTDAGGTGPMTCHAQQTSPMMLKYKAQKDNETFSVVTPNAGQAQSLFDWINGPGNPLSTHIGSAIVRVEGTTLVVVGLGSDVVGGTDTDQNTLTARPEVKHHERMSRSGSPATTSSP